MIKYLMKIKSKDLKPRTVSVTATSMVSVSCYEKAFIHIKIWIAVRNSMKHRFAQK